MSIFLCNIKWKTNKKDIITIQEFLPIGSPNQQRPRNIQVCWSFFCWGEDGEKRNLIFEICSKKHLFVCFMNRMKKFQAFNTQKIIIYKNKNRFFKENKFLCFKTILEILKIGRVVSSYLFRDKSFSILISFWIFKKDQ